MRRGKGQNKRDGIDILAESFYIASAPQLNRCRLEVTVMGLVRMSQSGKGSDGLTSGGDPGVQERFTPRLLRHPTLPYVF